MSLKLRQPDELDLQTEGEISLVERWKSWRETMELFLDLSMTGKTEEEKYSAILYIIGQKGREIHRTWELKDEERTVQTLLGKFESYCQPKTNVTLERFKFNTRNQNSHESIEEYATVLKRLAMSCSFGQLTDDLIKDRIVVGISSKGMKERLLTEPELTLDRALAICRTDEESKKGIELMVAGKVDAVITKPHYHRGSGQLKNLPKQKYEDSKRVKSKQPNGRCRKCGDLHAPRSCPAFGKICHNCKGKNHYAKVCRKVNAIDRDDGRQENCDKELFIGSVNNGTDNEWTVDIWIGGKRVNAKLDTGAQANVMSQREYRKLGSRENIGRCSTRLTSYAGASIPVIGEVSLRCHYKDKESNVLFILTSSNSPTVIGLKTCRDMNLIKKIASINTESATGKSQKQVPSKSFGTVKCQPVRIKLKEGTTPYSITTARRVPIPLQGKVRTELERMKEEGVVEEIKEPTEWVSPMIPVMKPNGNVRICVDLRKLNKAVERERFIIPTIDDIIHELRGSAIFSRLDAKSGFWQIPLHEATAKLTTFITPFGRFFFKRVPFGISSAPEIFQRTMMEILKGIEGVICYFDDILLHTKTRSDHSKLIVKVKERLQETGLSLNEEKCEYLKEELKFLGHIISIGGMRPDDKKIEAIVDMKKPENVNDLRRYLGMINYLGRYASHLSTVLKPINELLNKDTAWTWGPKQEMAFGKIKKMLTTAPTLAFYDPKLPTIVEADASSYGIGGVLMQKHYDGLKPVAFCSRTLTKAEQRYAQIEKECLAAVWSCERFDRYLMGLDGYTLYTDYKPLVPLINTKDLSDTPLRCQRLLMRMMRFKPTAEHRPGKEMLTSDTLSRSPLINEEDSNSNGKEQDIQSYVCMIKSSWPSSDHKLEAIRNETHRDEDLKRVYQYTQNGWPRDKQDVEIAIRDYFNICGELTSLDGLILKGDRIVIPKSMRKEMLERIHEGHQGITKSRERARQAVWWPRITKDVEARVNSCLKCLQKQPSQQKQSLLPTQLPDRPFQKVAIDLCEIKGKHYLVSVDYYSRWIDIKAISQLTSSAIIEKIKEIFSQHGIPEIIMSDNGPQFSSHRFKEFSIKWNFQHVTSSPRYPQANGEAERAVRTAKNILRQEDQYLALLTYRATPLPFIGISPAELTLGRRLRTTLPSHPTTLVPRNIDREVIRQRDDAYKKSTKQTFDKTAKDLQSFQIGSPVLLKENDGKSWNRKGEIVGKFSPRSYIVKTNDGEVRRNRQQIRADTSSIPCQTSSSFTSTVQQTAVEEASSQDNNESFPDQQQSETSPSSPTRRNLTRPSYTTRSGRRVQKPARFIE